MLSSVLTASKREAACSVRAVITTSSSLQNSWHNFTSSLLFSSLIRDDKNSGERQTEGSVGAGPISKVQGTLTSSNKRKRFNFTVDDRPKGYDYEWVVVKGGQRMLARAPAGTKRWRIWTSYEDLDKNQLLRQRRAQQGNSSSWLVDGVRRPVK